MAKPDAFDVIAGYTIMNDGSVRDWQKHSVPAGKNFTGSGASGPCFVTADEINDPFKMRLSTRLNGEEVQLRILRHGDMITLGRSILLLGTREQIEERLRAMAGAEVSQRTMDPSEVSDSSPDFDVGVPSPMALPIPLHAQHPPAIPNRMTPGQAAQLTELLEYFHVRLRQLLNAVEGEPAVGSMPRVSIDFEQWQILIDMQARFAEYLRGIGDPQSGK